MAPIKVSSEVQYKIRYALKVPAAFFACERDDCYLPRLEVLSRVLGEVEIDSRIMLPTVECFGLLYLQQEGYMYVYIKDNGLGCRL